MSYLFQKKWPEHETKVDEKETFPQIAADDHIWVYMVRFFEGGSQP